MRGGSSDKGNGYGSEPRDIYLTIPNLISILRIMSIPFIAALIAKHDMIPALVVMGISAASDGVDGIIARSFDQVSRIGQILDPVADRLLIFCSILALGLAGIIPWWMLLVVGLRDCLMAVEILVLAQHDYGPLPVHFVGKTGTALLMTSIVTLIVADMLVDVSGLVLRTIALAVFIWGIALYWLAGVLYAWQGVTLIKCRG
jgi:cardiolipin synthase